MSKLSRKLARLDPLHKMQVERDLDTALDENRQLRAMNKALRARCARHEDRLGLVEKLYHSLIDKVMGRDK